MVVWQVVCDRQVSEHIHMWVGTRYGGHKFPQPLDTIEDAFDSCFHAIQEAVEDTMAKWLGAQMAKPEGLDWYPDSITN